MCGGIVIGSDELVVELHGPVISRLDTYIPVMLR